MATKKVKKLAFGGLSNAVRAAANKAAAKIPAMTPVAPKVSRLMPPQAPANRTQAEADMAARKALNTAKAAGLGGEMLKAGAGMRPAGSGPMASGQLAKIASGISRSMMKKGGDVKESKAMVKKEIGFMKKAGAPKSMIKHEMAEAKGMKKGGMAECKTIAKKEVKGHEKRMHGMAKGGSIDGCAVRGKTKTSMVKMKKGGSC